MTNNENKLIETIMGRGVVTLREILDNLKVLRVEGDSFGVTYVVSRENKDLPWPAPYEAGNRLDGQAYYCCSYSTADEDEWPEDTKKLNVYRVFVDD